MTADIPLWEFHPDWDTKLSHERFLKYFLIQPAGERSAIQAYRLFRAESARVSLSEKEGYKTVEEAMRVPAMRRKLERITVEDFKKSPIGSSWRQWYEGKDSGKVRMYYTDDEGNEVPVPTWQERAHAYDVWMRQKEQKHLEKQRIHEVERELRASDMLWDVLEKALRNAKALVVEGEYEEPELDAAGRETGRIRVVQTVGIDAHQIGALMRTVRDLSTERRRALGMATDVIESHIGGIPDRPIEHKISGTLSLEDKLKIARERVMKFDNATPPALPAGEGDDVDG